MEAVRDWVWIFSGIAQWYPYIVKRLGYENWWNDHLRENALIILSNSLNTFIKEIFRDQFGEFVCGYGGLEG